MKVCPVCGIEYADDLKFCPADGHTLRAASPAATLVGQVIADSYYVQRKLGEGGMGEVYLAEHVKMGRKSAIKVMSAAMAHDPDSVARFNREAKNASQINHPNVCAIYDFGETPDGLIFLAMEFVEGEPLTALLAREGTLALPRAVDITRQVGEALQAAHDLGIVHRDLKPDNVMLMRRGNQDVVKVVDFGIAKAVGAEQAGQKVTKTGFVVGTPDFMSPEQLSGDPLDGRSDLYSLALVFYQMVTGTLPFTADSAQEAMVKRLTDQPVPLAAARPDLKFPPEVQAVLDRALARRASDRYASVTLFAQDLIAASGGGATQQLRATRQAGDQRTQAMEPGAKPPAGPPRARAPAKPKRRAPVLAIAVVTVAVIGGGAAGVMVLLGNEGPADTSGVGGTATPADSPAISLASESVPSGGGDTARPVGTDPIQTSRDPDRNSSTAGRSGGGGAPSGGAVQPPPRDLGTTRNDIIRLSRDPTDANRDQLRAYARDAALPDSLRANAASGLAEAFYFELHMLDSALTWANLAVALDPSKSSYQTVRDQIRAELGRSN